MLKERSHLAPVPAQNNPPMASTGRGHPVIPTPPASVMDALRGGVVESRMLFPEHGAVRELETWRAPRVAGRELEEVQMHLSCVEKALAPADPGDLLARILALLSHYRLEAHSEQVEERIADDWLDDLGGYPMWVVETAAKQWRRTKKFKPQICEMIALCEAEVGRNQIVRDRLRSIVERSVAEANPLAERTAGLARSMFRVVPFGGGR
jgi:hypothetical protein